jgi:hypothetical protein
MILFAVLAFRPDPAKHNAPAGRTLSPGNGHMPSAPAMLQVFAAQPSPTGTIMPVSSTSIISTPGSDSSNGAGTSHPMI